MRLLYEFVAVSMYVNVKFSACFIGLGINAQRLGIVRQKEPLVKGCACGQFNICACYYQRYLSRVLSIHARQHFE